MRILHWEDFEGPLHSKLAAWDPLVFTQEPTNLIGSAQTRGFLKRLRNQLLPLQSQQLLGAQRRPNSTLELFILRILKINNYLGCR